MSDTDSPRAFVTGASGMIGSHLVRRALDEGWRVRALVRPTSDTSLLEEWGVDLVQGDVTDPASGLAPHLDDVHYVFHCAALVSDWARLEDMVRVNVDGTRHLAEAAIACPTLKRFVYLSSMIVFGMHPQRDLDETAPLILTGDNYNITKIRSEELVQQFVRERGLPAAILRPPYVYGPRDRQVLPRILKNIKNGRFKFLGRGRQPISLVYVGNLAQAMFRAATQPDAAGEVFLVTNGDAITRERLVEIICEELGYPMPTAHVPTWLVRMLCPILEGLHSLRKTQEPPLVNKTRVKFMSTPLTYSIEKARRVLGYEPESGTEETLRWTLAWVRENWPDLLPEA